ncbi:MAG: DNA-binding response regulator [Proteobacteria bacterium]|nr:DNA-binding response regulator [Pseudomonadota bacterium]
MGSKILVIEDEPAIITSVSYSLRKEGYEVVTATDGQTGLETARRDTPDLIVLDVMLPRLTGLDVCRAIRSSPSAQRPISLGTITLDPAQRRVTRNGSNVALKPREFDLLACLLRHPGQVFTRDHLLARAWGSEFSGDMRTVDVHIRWLREKLEEDPGNPKIIETVRGVGYRSCAPD